MDRQVVLTISVLISDRPDTVRKCLDSVKPLLENLSSELILVDTGCGDEVGSIIREYTEQIIKFQWCRDFSKARNAGLERAKGKWFLYLDDDEWFEDVTEIIHFFQSGEYRRYGVALYNQRNYLFMDGSEYSELWVARMVRLEPDIKFIYKIHECFNRAPGRAKKLDVYVHHYGYIYQNKEEAQAHAMRNITLLLEERAEHPKNMRHILQLAQEYNSISRRDKSLELSQEAITCAEKGPVEAEYCLSSLYANEINCYMELGRYREAVEKGEMYLKSSPTDKLVKALIAGRLTSAYMESGDYESCLERTGQYWNVYQEYRKNPDSFMSFISPVTDTCFHERRRTLFLGNGIRAAVRLGHAGLAWEWFLGIGWEGNRAYMDRAVIRDILAEMVEAEEGERKYYTNICNILLEHEELKDSVTGMMMELCSACKDRIRAVRALGDLRPVHWFLKLAKLVAAAFFPETGTALSKEEAESMAAQVWSVMEESMEQIKAYDMPGAVDALGGDNRRVMESMPLLRWERGIAWYFSRFSWKDTGWWAEQMDRILDPQGMHMLVWRAGCGISRASESGAELERRESPDSPEEMDGAIKCIEEGLREYAICRTELCERIYRPEIIRSMPDILPEEYRGAYFIWNLLEMTEKGKYKEAVKAVREIRELLPGLSGIMKQYLRWLDGLLERQKTESRQAVGEFQVLARQIKAKIYALLEAGEYGAALSVTEQVQALLPEDEEILRLREEIGRKV